MIVEGHALCIPGDDIDTDVLYPGPFLNIEDPEEMKTHLFDGLDPALRDRLGDDTILVVGANFGMGSSREHVPLAMKAWGIRCVVGKSFARIFQRNCVNLALPVITCPDAVDAARTGSSVHLDLAAGAVDIDAQRFRVAGVPDFMHAMFESGGLIPWVRRRLTSSEGVTCEEQRSRP